MNAGDINVQSAGHAWLQGTPMESADLKTFEFSPRHARPSEIIAGLSWFLSLRGPTLIALDQLDAIVGQHHLMASVDDGRENAPGQRTSQGIITGIAGGLAALRDMTKRSLIVVSCLDATLAALETHAARSFMERYRPASKLGFMHGCDVARAIVEARLRSAYEAAGFTPPYPSWPFTGGAFDDAAALLPRELLMRCENHRLACKRAGDVIELLDFSGQSAPVELTPRNQDDLDRIYEAYRGQAEPDRLIRQEDEDTVLSALLVTAARCLVKENPRDENVDAIVDTEFPGGRSFKPLHARIRLVHINEDSLERHYCMRALQKTHAVAYQSRLKAAMTQSGIDRDLQFRRLIIVRTNDVPSGRVTQALTRRFTDSGGIFVRPSHEEIAVLWALRQMESDRAEGFDAWLMQRRPVSRLQMLKDARLVRDGVSTHSHEAEMTTGVGEEGIVSTPETQPAPPTATSPEPQPASSTPVNSPPSEVKALPFGKRLIGTQAKEELLVPIEKLRQHVIVLAGAGSGKTVLLRRIVEEAALAGVPSIVVDSANDLARLGDPWPDPPEAWVAGDAEKAAAYFESSQTIVWTPGREGGNPMRLDPIPDLAAVVDDSDELDEAVDMAVSALTPIVAPGSRTATAMNKLGVLSAALRYFAQHGGGDLYEFTEMLSALPSDAGGGISQADRDAAKMADSIRAKIQLDPLLKQEGAVLDMDRLFGLGESHGKARVSVISLVGLPGADQQQSFLNQLAMTLFSWIKKHPAPPDKPLRGLLVIDEAKDFVPSRGDSACKNSITRLAAQARKYGLGLVFATQAPKDIEHTIVSNCFTHLYGQANSPAAIDVIQTQLRQRGGSGSDVSRIGKGKFYFYSEGIVDAPTKITASLCLSHHPSNPLSPEEVIDRAGASRRMING